MRPYPIPHSPRWVDLDTIQQVFEPVYVSSTSAHVVLYWHHAFQEKRDSVCFEDEIRKRRPPEVEATMRAEFVPPPDWRAPPEWPHSEWRIAYDGNEPAKLVWVRIHVFIPFWEAWSGLRYPKETLL